MPLLLFYYSLQLSLSQLHKLECFLIFHPDIIAVFKAVKIELQMEHLLVSWIVIEVDNWHAVVQLESEGVHTVVD